MSENRCIGVNNTIPWRLAADLGRFRETTTLFSVVMGRKTWESLPEKMRPLPDRYNIVISSSPDFKPTGVTVATSLEHALEILSDNPIVFIIGGAKIYEQALPIATDMLITRVHHHVDGDTFFPVWGSEWEMDHRTHKQVQLTELGDIHYTYETYRRIKES